MILLLVGGAAGGLWYWNEIAPKSPQKIGVFSVTTGKPIMGIPMIADSKTGEVQRLGFTDPKGHLICQNPGTIDISTIRAAGFDWDRVEDPGTFDQANSIDLPVFLAVNPDKAEDEAAAEIAAEKSE